MIDADRLIENIDKFNAVCAKHELEQCKTAVERFDLAIKMLDYHREDIENAGKALWNASIPCKSLSAEPIWRPAATCRIPV